MGNKNERLNIIKKVVSEELIGSQEELIKHLEKHGVKATQSTLSRDFKEINISKMPHPEKGYVYVLSESLGSEPTTNSANLADAILSVKFSHNLCVLTTKSGYASAISVIIDSRKNKDILGSLAGDNNILLVMAEQTSHSDVEEFLASIFPNLACLK